MHTTIAINSLRQSPWASWRAVAAGTLVAQAVPAAMHAGAMGCGQQVSCCAAVLLLLLCLLLLSSMPTSRHAGLCCAALKPKGEAYFKRFEANRAKFRGITLSPASEMDTAELLAGIREYLNKVLLCSLRSISALISVSPQARQESSCKGKILHWLLLSLSHRCMQIHNAALHVQEVWATTFGLPSPHAWVHHGSGLAATAAGADLQEADQASSMGGGTGRTPTERVTGAEPGATVIPPPDLGTGVLP